MVLVLAAAGVADGGRLAQPAADAAAQTELTALRGEIGQKRIGDAVARYDVIRRLHGGELVRIEYGGLISLTTCLDQLDDADQALLTTEYRKLNDDAAHRMLQAAALDAKSQPADFYAVARRYPLSSAAPAALVAGGDRAAAMGDWPAAEAMYGLARSMGWMADQVHSRRMDDLARAQNMADWSGPIPFDATWYGRADTSAIAKFFPVAAGGLLYVAGPADLLVFKADADAAWTFPRASAADHGSEFGYRRDQGDQFAPTGNAPLAPGVFHFGASFLAADNSARLLAIVTPRADVQGHFLQAVRGSDGKLLWSTDDNEKLAALDLLPAPVICGRFVYALATGRDGQLFLIALDLTTGRELWRTALGKLTVDPGRFNEPAGITVDGDQLLLCPNVGCVMAVDRFNGQLRWLHPYASLDQSPAAAADVGHWGLPPTARYDNRPRVSGTTAFFAPQDAQSAFALNSRTGEHIWDSPSAYADMTLIGTTGQCALFQGGQILAVQASAADAAQELAWTYSPRPEAITGPAIVRGSVVFVPTTAGAAVPVSTDDGRELTSPPPLRPPNFRVIVNSQTGPELIPRAAMKTFGFPPPQGRRNEW
jgi:outer membrane protein assembly factor BamB